MELELKKRILDHLRRTSGYFANPELDDEHAELIRKMENEVNFVDINTHSVCVDDLSNYDTEELRSKLGKADGEEYTIEDCEKVSNAIADYICDDFGEDLANAIEHEL